VSDTDGKNEWIGTAFIGLGLAGLGLFGGLAAASGTMGPAAIPIWLLVILGGVVLARSPVARAFAQRISDSREEPEAVPDEVYAELDELRSRVSELEDRQDFSERLLADRAAVTEGE
jgi:hypothetical protein